MRRVKLDQVIVAHRYVNFTGCVNLQYIRAAEAIIYSGGQRDTRILASSDGIYYRWYISFGGDYRPQCAADESGYDVLCNVECYEDGTYSR